jgi:hypothetical protein
MRTWTFALRQRFDESLEYCARDVFGSLGIANP